MTDNEPTSNGTLEYPAIDDNVRELANGIRDHDTKYPAYDDTDIYNCFSAKPWLDTRDKATYPYEQCVPGSWLPRLYTKISDYTNMIDTMVSIYNDVSLNPTREYFLFPISHMYLIIRIELLQVSPSMYLQRYPLLPSSRRAISSLIANRIRIFIWVIS